MKSRIPVLAAAFLLPLGLVACSGSPAQPTSGPPAPATTARATAPGGGGVIPDACASLEVALTEAGDAMDKVSEAATGDPQDAVDTWTALVDAFTKAANSSTNPEVKTAATALAEDFAKVRDAMRKALVDKDLSAMGDLATATSEMQESYNQLLALCGP